MGKQAGYLIDLAKVQLDENDGIISSWIQAIPVGEYMHPVHGKLSFDLDRIRRFAENVKNQVRGQDLDIDYDHKERSGEAAGWIKSAEARSDGLWVLVEWTKSAAQKIKERAYRYFSPEFDDEWTHPKSGQVFKDVLFGGGITNRPFLKDILPINLSEAFAEGAQEVNQGGSMDPKKLRELLGLPEDATDEQVDTALTKRLSEGGTGSAGASPAGDESGKDDLNKEVIQLAESHPAVAKLVEQVQAQQRQLAEVGVTLRLAEVTNQVTQLSEKAAEKGRAIPPALSDEIKALLIEAPKAFADKFLNTVTKLAETGFVELGERGETKNLEDGQDAVKTFSEKVAELRKAHEDLSYADAVEEIAKQHPKLFTEYQTASYNAAMS